MKEICIPLEKVKESTSADLEIKLSDSQQKQLFRLESVKMTEGDGLKNTSKSRVELLKKFISSYNNNWELIQILDSREGANYIHLLYRKRT